MFPDSFDCVRQSLFPPLEKLCKSLIMNPFWYASGSLHLALHSGTRSTCTFDTITFLFLCLEINFLLSILLLSLPCLVAIQIVKPFCGAEILLLEKHPHGVKQTPVQRAHCVFPWATAVLTGRNSFSADECRAWKWSGICTS